MKLLTINELPAVFLTGKGTVRNTNISRAAAEVLTTGSARTGSSSMYGKKVYTHGVVAALRALGYEAVGMNDAPKGGANGEYVVLTWHRCPNKKARAKYIKEWRTVHSMAMREEWINDPANMLEAVKKAINIVANDEYKGYRGCGFYIAGWKDGKMVLTIYGGFAHSRPWLADREKWNAMLKEEALKHCDYLVSMDGSGCQFFFENFEDAEKVGANVDIYNVPTAQGGMHTNIQVI
jgi:hypothetical protein